MLRTTPRFLCTLGLLFGCAQGDPDRPLQSGPAPGPSPGARDAAVASLLDDASEPIGPSAVAQTSELRPFDLTPSKLFSPAIQAARAVPPLSGGTLAIAGGSTVLVSDPDRDQVYWVDTDKKIAKALTLQSGDEPGRIATDEKRAFVALRAGGALVTIDLATQQVSARTAICAAPRGVFVDVSESRVLAACAGGDLVSLSLDGTRVLAKTRIAADLRDIGRDAGGLWVSQFRSAALLRLNASLQVHERRLPSSIGVVSRSPTSDSNQPPLTPTLAFRTIASGGEVFMLHQRARTAAVATDPGGYGGSQDAFCEGGIVHTTVSRFGAARPEAQAALPQAVVPVDLGLSPDGRWVAVVAPGNFVRQDVAPVESFFEAPRGPAQQLYLTETTALKRALESAPLGVNEGDCLQTSARWEHRFPGEAIAVQFLDARTLLVQVRDPAELHVFRFDDSDAPRLSAIIPLSALPARDTGHQVFHQNTGAGIACASCHGEALDDAHTWTFATIGARRTQHLRGGVLANAPFHWSGDLASFDALLDDVYQKRMGAVPLEVDARSALVHWLDAVPLIPTEAADAPAAARGHVLFASAALGCTRCHAGESLRSSGSYDVGTGGSFKAPSLRGLSLRLPLMHNGCADTLEKRFDPSCGGGDKHGTTSQLSGAQLQDLVAYLGSL